MNMARRKYSYIRINRRRWGLTQAELAHLIGLSGAAAVSHIERATRQPSAHAIIGCTMIFGIPALELLPTLHKDIEDNVIAAARTLAASLSDATDRRSELVRSLLNDILLRLTSSDDISSV